MASSNGWIAIHRNLQYSWIWEDKPFSKGQAWIDLIMLANHKENKFPFGNEIITIERGSFITSEIKLMERWGWSKSKVRNFLSLLENDSMLVKKTDRKKTTLTIVNYSVYQDLQTTEEPIKDHKKTNKKPIKDTNNNVNNENNNNKESNYQLIADMYNNTCVSFPKLSKLSDSRKKAIKARQNTYTVEDFKRLFELAEKSEFLKGKNGRNWMANFDWLIKDANMAKVLDGNYEDMKLNKQVSNNKFNNFNQREYDYKQLERDLLGMESVESEQGRRE